MSSQPILRFAPSPNGHLHLGHAYSALFTWRAAAEIGGVALLRIEDTDVTRCKPEFADAIMEDLAWLGLSWPEPVLYQSTRFPTYAHKAAELAARNLLYPCFCSRSEIAVAATARDPDGAPLYPGTCRHLSEAEIAERLKRGDPVQYRLKSDRAIALAGPLHFRFAQPDVTAPVETRVAHPELWGDVVLQRKGTPTSYHLSVVIDDDAQGITHVTRGKDMEAATDFHVLLQALLGLASPIYTFHELILDEEGKKLSKSRESESLRALRAAGWSADDVRRHLGFA
ncbi:tRNA glutamyl-Q(34) synthetase GluQRS [Paradevosia shaoguanensis]|uniref:tRNA glutamyl-Q(34) synthetase GluQRS n=1 Tax=Paradevosia shaoguanensis TaxID=1335043 RepID=UPI003C78E5E1